MLAVVAENTVPHDGHSFHTRSGEKLINVELTCGVVGAGVAIVGVPLSLRASLNILKSSGQIYSMNLNNTKERTYAEIATPFVPPVWDESHLAGPTFGSTVSLGRSANGATLRHPSTLLPPPSRSRLIPVVPQGCTQLDGQIYIPPFMSRQVFLTRLDILPHSLLAFPTRVVPISQEITKNGVYGLVLHNMSGVEPQVPISFLFHNATSGKLTAREAQGERQLEGDGCHRTQCDLGDTIAAGHGFAVTICKAPQP